MRYFHAVKLGSVVVRDGIATSGVYFAKELGNPEKCLRYTSQMYRVF